MTNDMTEGPTVADRISELGTDYEEEPTDVRQDLLDDGVDLPELADTMQEATARAAASTYLFALRNIERDHDANDAEFTVLQDYNQNRHVERQATLIRRMDYLRGVLEGLFGFMEVTGKKKSLNLLGGRLGMRSQQDELVVDDDVVVIAWARDRKLKDVVKIKLALDRRALRIWVEKMGTNTDPGFAPPPGVKLNERPDVFFATPAD